MASARHEAELDVEGFTRFALDQGWGDGLPLVPPTEARVRAFLAAHDRFPDEAICTLPPANAVLTVEKIAINAVMAGAPAGSLELLIAMALAIAEPDFELYGVNTTTAPVFPAFVANGPVRTRLGIPCGHGCFGGAASPAVAIGRAMRLIIRNVAGQVAGVTSQTTFGSPGRIAGVLVGEWEERSPWAPLAERRCGIAGDAVTSFGAMGTMNVLDTTSQAPSDFVEMIGRSLIYPATNCLSPAMAYGEVMVAINPVWAEILAPAFPDIADLQAALWREAALPGESLQARHREQLEAQGRIRADGRIYLTPEPKDILLFVCGGTGGLHATVLHSFGSCLAQTQPLAGPRA
ncbi:MAG: hypothetical protein KGK11_05640 [Sphingomonadales bacterium]|nr:hypothetical protein [Sphingomonadales bacterium]